ncbi:hypothetical protein MRX96_001442 [Rhipicephalus microplus]
MPLFPGHRYLGPGNLLRNGDPVDEDNGIAKSHDEAYERATSHEDVFAADQASAALFLNGLYTHWLLPHGLRTPWKTGSSVVQPCEL